MYESHKEGLGHLRIGENFEYVGDFINDDFSGTGLIRILGELEYMGDFKESKRHGLGTLIKADGSQEFHGGFNMDRKHGMGVLVRGQDDAREAWFGQWVDDKLEGEAFIVELPKGETARKAFFKNDRMVAKIAKAGPQTVKDPEGRIITVSQREINAALEHVKNALQ